MPTEQKHAVLKLGSKQLAQPSQHKHQPVRSGALTILITVVALSLAVLSVLALTTARADLALTQRRMQTVKQSALTESAAQKWLTQISDAIKTVEAELMPNNASTLLISLPEGTTVSKNGLLEATISENDTEYLSVAVQIIELAPKYEIVRWQLLKNWQPNEDVNLWDGE